MRRQPFLDDASIKTVIRSMNRCFRLFWGGQPLPAVGADLHHWLMRWSVLVELSQTVAVQWVGLIWGRKPSEFESLFVVLMHSTHNIGCAEPFSLVLITSFTARNPSLRILRPRRFALCRRRLVRPLLISVCFQKLAGGSGHCVRYTSR